MRVQTQPHNWGLRPRRKRVKNTRRHSQEGGANLNRREAFDSEVGQVDPR
jgi:hypothetical protein